VNDFSTKPVSESLLTEIKNSLENKEYGSIEIYIEGGRVVQITERIIRKTNGKNESTRSEPRKPNYIYSRTQVRYGK
jgi:hypothetical protein